MTLALAASTDNWELTGSLFWMGALVMFGLSLWGFAALAKAGTPPKPGSRQHLEQRLRLAEQDEIVAAYRRDAAEAWDVDRPGGRHAR